MNRAQHFVPQGYLNSFKDPAISKKYPRLWVYEKDKAPRHARVSEVAHQRDFYSFMRNGMRDNSVDTEFLQTIENSLPTLLEFARSGRVPSAKRETVADYVAVLSARVPIARNFADETFGETRTADLLALVDDPEQFEYVFNEKLKPQLLDNVSAEEARRLFKEGYRVKQASEEFNLGMMLQMARKNKDALLEMNWACWRAPGEQQFVTSDNPVISVEQIGIDEGRPGSSFDDPKTNVVLAITPGCALFAGRNVAAGLHQVNGTAVRRINKAIMGLADRYLFASHRSAVLRGAYEKYGRMAVLGSDFYVPF